MSGSGGNGSIRSAPSWLGPGGGSNRLRGHTSEPLKGRVIVKGPRAFNADNQIPPAEVIRQLIDLTFVNGETPHRARHDCRSNTVQPGLELLQSNQVIHGYPSRHHTHFPNGESAFKRANSPYAGALLPS